MLLLPDTRSPKREAFRAGGHTDHPWFKKPDISLGAGSRWPSYTCPFYLACSAHTPCWPFRWLLCTENGYCWHKWLKVEVKIWNMSSACDEASILLNSHNCLHKICIIPGQLTLCRGSGGSRGLMPPCRFISSYHWIERGRRFLQGCNHWDEAHCPVNDTNTAL